MNYLTILAGKMKNKIISAAIFIVVGQLVALIIWLIFKENYYIPMLIASTVGFLAGYKGKKNTNVA